MIAVCFVFFHFEKRDWFRCSKLRQVENGGRIGTSTSMQLKGCALPAEVL